ncbi:MAG TPA: ABC transporter permease [Steroidobacteraceae bacterium]|jgi:putative ABC transport system permease protein
MHAWKQLVVLLQMSLGSFEGRLGPSVVTLVGTACVVGVFISMLSMGTGARLAAESGASPDRAVIENSIEWVRRRRHDSQQNVALVENEPGIRHDSYDKPMASSIFTSTITSYKKSDDSRVFAPVNGVQPEFPRVVPELKLTAGRMFRPGLHEVIVGKTRYTEDRGMTIGDRIWLRGNEWIIVGHFEARGMLNSALLTDALTLMSASGSKDFTRVLVTLDQPEGFARLRHALRADPTPCTSTSSTRPKRISMTPNPPRISWASSATSSQRSWQQAQRSEQSMHCMRSSSNGAAKWRPCVPSDSEASLSRWRY